ncbi:MAG TPA: hypothetical protein VHQ87_15910 [Rhizobacter sp.]|nr:hypothetical protein [Rhizobacter sp.]
MKWSAAWCLVLACATAQAQTVYRCGAEGRMYSQTPCALGRVVIVSDERSTEQQAAALAQAHNDQTTGDALERERREREARPPTMAASIDSRHAVAESPDSTAPASKNKKKSRKGRSLATEDFQAIAPPAKKAKQASL